MPDEIATIGEQLSDEFKSDEGMSKFLAGNADSLAKSYLASESKLGTITKEFDEKLAKNYVEIPGEGADDATRRSFFTKLGCPERATEYPDVEIKGVPEGFERDDKVVQLIKDACHKVGASNSQYKAVMETIVKEQLVSLDTFVKQDKAAEEEADKELTQAWGGEAKKKEKVELAKRLVKHYDPESKISEFLMDSRLGNYAPLVKLLGNIAADILAEETTFTGEVAAAKKEGQVEYSPTTGEALLVYDKSPELK